MRQQLANWRFVAVLYLVRSSFQSSLPPFLAGLTLSVSFSTRLSQSKWFLDGLCMYMRTAWQVYDNVNPFAVKITQVYDFAVKITFLLQWCPSPLTAWRRLTKTTSTRFALSWTRGTRTTTLYSTFPPGSTTLQSMLFEPKFWREIACCAAVCFERLQHHLPWHRTIVFQIPPQSCQRGLVVARCTVVKSPRDVVQKHRSVVEERSI